MSEVKDNDDVVDLVFLPSPRIKEGLQKVGSEQQSQKFIAKVEDIVKWFKKCTVDSIELYIEGAATSGKIAQLFVSFEGKGGCKVVLKPT